MKSRKVFQFLGFAIGIFCLVLAFSQVHWGTFFMALVSIRPAWLVLSAASLFVAMYMRSVRWRLVSGLPRTDQSKVWESACVGYLGAVIYPARAGEVLRMLRLQQLTGMGGGLAIGGAVIDRILDGLGLCCMLLMLVFAWGCILTL